VVPFPNFTNDNTNVEERSRGMFGEILHYFERILLPPSYSSSDKEFNSFLQIANKDVFFDVPVIEAVTTSRWTRTRRYWMIPLIFYIIFLFLFSFLSQHFLSDNYDNDKYNAFIMTMVGIFYYVGMYLLLIEFMQIGKYKIFNYCSNIFNIFDLCSTILGVMVFTFIFAKSFNKTDGINNEEIVILLTITTLILWIEMVCIINIMCKYCINFKNIYINYYLFFQASLATIIYRNSCIHIHFWKYFKNYCTFFCVYACFMYRIWTINVIFVLICIFVFIP
jgi:hypothetical protein